MLLDEQNQRVDLYISHLGGVLVCPETGETRTLYDHRKARTWRHLDCHEFEYFVHCRIPRIKSSLGVRTNKTPWASASNRFTDAFERWTINLLKATKNQTKTAKLLRSKFDTVNRIMHLSVTRGMKRRSLDEIAHVSVDEKAFQRGHSYATIVSYSEHGVVIDIGEGRDKTSIETLLNRLLAEKKGQVRTITTDMWKAYITTVQGLFPKAHLIHDRFHLIQYLNKGIDQVRRREVNQHEELKHSRYALLKNEQHQTQKQDEIVKVNQESNLQVSVAWR
ncbi:MAG: ISL3 family transposase [Bacteroidetes bacterium]|nr:ISL3 family transposase [Bacteroidota bacterium]